MMILLVSGGHGADSRLRDLRSSTNSDFYAQWAGGELFCMHTK